MVAVAGRLVASMISLNNGRSGDGGHRLITLPPFSNSSHLLFPNKLNELAGDGPLFPREKRRCETREPHERADQVWLDECALGELNHLKHRMTAQRIIHAALAIAIAQDPAGGSRGTVMIGSAFGNRVQLPSFHPYPDFHVPVRTSIRQRDVI